MAFSLLLVVSVTQIVLNSISWKNCQDKVYNSYYYSHYYSNAQNQPAKPLISGKAAPTHDCFDSTDWNMFREAAAYGSSINSEEYIEPSPQETTKSPGLEQRSAHC